MHKEIIMFVSYYILAGRGLAVEDLARLLDLEYWATTIMQRDMFCITAWDEQMTKRSSKRLVQPARHW